MEIAGSWDICHTHSVVLEERIPYPHIEGIEISHCDAGDLIVDELVAQHRGLGAAIVQIAAAKPYTGILEHIIGILVAGIEIVALAVDFGLVNGDGGIALAIEGQSVKARVC